MTSAPRAAGEADVAALVALIHDAYRGESGPGRWTTEAHLLGGNRIDATMLRAEVADPATTVLIMEDSGGPLACCAVTDRGGGTAYFGTFAVRPGAQGAGIGQSLLTAAEELARARGAHRMEMTVLAQRADLLAWYVRRGYTDTGATRPFPYGDERYGRPRRPDLVFTVLRRDLEPT